MQALQAIAYAAFFIILTVSCLASFACAAISALYY